MPENLRKYQLKLSVSMVETDFDNEPTGNGLNITLDTVLDERDNEGTPDYGMDCWHRIRKEMVTQAAGDRNLLSEVLGYALDEVQAGFGDPEDRFSEGNHYEDGTFKPNPKYRPLNPTEIEERRRKSVEWIHANGEPECRVDDIDTVNQRAKSSLASYELWKASLPMVAAG